MPEPLSAFFDPLTEAARIAATGPISPAGRAAFLGIGAAVDGMPPAARRAAIWAALFRLAEDEPAMALHGLAAAIRAERDAAIRATEPRRRQQPPPPL